MGEIDDSQRGIGGKITSHGGSQERIIIPNYSTQRTQDDIGVSYTNQTLEPHSTSDTNRESRSGWNGNGNSLDSSKAVAPPVENYTSVVSPGLPNAGNGQADSDRKSVV